MARLSAWAGLLLLAGSAAAAAGLEAPLTGVPGDPARGRALLLDTQASLCLLCHPGPFPEVPFQGDLAPDLAGVGDRLTVPELRLRLVDSRRVNPGTLMPPFHATDGLARVGARWRDAPILDAQGVEDVVAFLATLQGDSP